MTDLKHTPLHALHLELGAKMVPFAGYDMPVQYPLGVKKEHGIPGNSVASLTFLTWGRFLYRGKIPPRRWKH